MRCSACTGITRQRCSAKGQKKASTLLCGHARKGFDQLPSTEIGTAQSCRHQTACQYIDIDFKTSPQHINLLKKSICP
jgi:hypothetical protein